MNRIMVVDDDQTILKVIRLNLEKHDLQVLTAGDAGTALDKMNGEECDLALVDLMLNGQSGLDLMEKLHRLRPEMPIIILTGYGSVETAVEAMKKGACTYLTKPLNFDELLLQIRDCIKKRDLTREVKRLQNIVEDNDGRDKIIGKSKEIKAVLSQVAKAADSNSIVFIKGESGTGKELIARSLHLASARKDGPFIAINCAAIPETLLESELFGHEKGAFTDAVQNKKGFFIQAQGGTFFMDEISEMPLRMQAKLLRVLEDKTVYPLGGGATPQAVDVRILVASNKDLELEVQSGNFRKDLFYRIHVIPIHLPPLRERKEDIPLLARHFLIQAASREKKKIEGLSAGALEKLLGYHWPGNVRELKNAVDAAVLMADGNQITADMILPSHRPADEALKPLKHAKADFEKDYLEQLMQMTRGNVTLAARLSGKYRADFYELLKKYDMDPAGYRN